MCMYVFGSIWQPEYMLYMCMQWFCVPAMCTCIMSLDTHPMQVCVFMCIFEQMWMLVHVCHLPIQLHIDCIEVASL